MPDSSGIARGPDRAQRNNNIGTGRLSLQIFKEQNCFYTLKSCHYFHVDERHIGGEQNYLS